MEKLLILFIVFLSIGTPVAFAQTPPKTGTKSAVMQTAAISRLKTRADAEITRRINALNTLTAKINAMKRLTADQKSAFAAGISGQITSLTGLKTKIDADSDLTVLRTDVKSIVASYRIFVLYMPQVHIMSMADRALAIIEQMTAVSSKLQSRIDAAKNAGKETASMVSLMSDRTAKLSDATTQAKNALNAVVPLTPDGYPGNKTTLESARTMLQTVRTDLKTAESDASQIRKLLK
jgi:hypothetical protein